MNNPFTPSESIYLDQNHNEVESVYANGRIHYGFKYLLNWTSDGTNTLSWKPDANYQLVANNLDLDNPEVNTTVYLKTHKSGAAPSGLIKAYNNRGGLLRIHAVFDSEDHREQFRNLIASQINLIAENTIKPNVQFWYTHPSYGPSAMTKAIDVPVDDKIMFNYSSTIRPQLMDLINLPAEKAIGGKLILLHGVPGTGKTYLIRHLMHKWRSWCNFQYISDPENFFQNPAYLFEVTKFFTSDELPTDYKDGMIIPSTKTKSTLVVLEDAGEFIEADSNSEFVAKSLNKLLNITDGLLGQGLKLLILVTTNREAKSLDPAILRSGRCLSNIEFTELPELDVLEWCKKNNSIVPNNLTPRLLADLYNLRESPTIRKIGF